MDCNISHLPRGFKFVPKEEHLIEYLHEKIDNKKLELDLRFLDINNVEPWKLPDLCKLASDVEQTEWYFFTRLEKQSTGSSLANRTTKEGHWKTSGPEKPVYYESDPTSTTAIGMRRTLVFYKRRGAEEQITECVINEYRIPSTPPKGDGLVLCKLHTKHTAKRKRNESPSKANIAGSSSHSLPLPKMPSIPYSSSHSIPQLQQQQYGQLPPSIPYSSSHSLPLPQRPSIPYSSSHSLPQLHQQYGQLPPSIPYSSSHSLPLPQRPSIPYSSSHSLPQLQQQYGQTQRPSIPYFSSHPLPQQLQHGQTQNLPQSDEQEAAIKEADTWMNFGTSSPTN